MQFLRTTGLFFRTHLYRLAWSQRSLICVAIAFLPALIGLAAAALTRRTSPAELAVHLGFLQLQVILPVLALIAGSAAVAEEVEDRTITFLFTRPIPRPSLLFGRLGAILVFLTALLAASTWALLAACATGRVAGAPVDAAIVEPLLLAMLAGGVVYAGLFAVLGVFFKHPMIVGLAYTFAVEGFVANLPGGIQSCSLQFYLRSLIAAGGAPAWNEVEGFASTAFEPHGAALWKLGAVLAIVLALGAWRIARREFVLAA
jgi:ABC-type transport system involved in multi-copper enzyme maturation permease subunit